MYGYGTNNEFDFTKYNTNEIIGIFGSNGVGKSAFLDILTFMLFNKSARSKSERIPKDIININCDSSCGMLVIESNNLKYLIIRKCNRENTKKNQMKMKSKLFELTPLIEKDIKKKNTFKLLGKEYTKKNLTEEHRINTNEIIFIIPRNMQSNVIKQFTREPLAPQA